MKHAIVTATSPLIGHNRLRFHLRSLVLWSRHNNLSVPQSLTVQITYRLSQSGDLRQPCVVKMPSHATTPARLTEYPLSIRKFIFITKRYKTALNGRKREIYIVTRPPPRRMWTRPTSAASVDLIHGKTTKNYEIWFCARNWISIAWNRFLDIGVAAELDVTDVTVTATEAAAILSAFRKLRADGRKLTLEHAWKTRR